MTERRGSSPWQRLHGVVVCPLCGAPLDAVDAALRCPAGHSFDIARHGYVSLLTGDMQVHTADTPAMVEVRVAFLAAGHYGPAAHQLAATAATVTPAAGVVLDAGAGTGYFLTAVLDALPAAAGLALDASKHALRRAARAHSRMAAAVWDVWKPLPVATASTDLVVNVFAPRNGPEYRRVLRPGGALLVVTPTPRHLAELRERLGLLTVDEDKPERLRRTLGGHFAEEGAQDTEYVLDLSPADAAHAVAMGPNAHHTDAPHLDAPIRVTASFRIAVYRPLKDGR